MEKLLLGECTEVMAGLDPESVDMVVTSPPYDDLRTYNGYEFNAKAVLAGLLRVIKPGGVVCWVMGDQTKGGGRTGNSFRTALTAQAIGFLIHDVIVWHKPGNPYTHKGRYTNCWEYVFVFSKGKPKTFNPIRVPKKEVRKGYDSFKQRGTAEGKGYEKLVRKAHNQDPLKVSTNMWTIYVGGGSTAPDGTTKHPAMMPLKLAEDCITSWSNPGDLVLDPMNGSGTTCVAAKRLTRDYIGIDISEEYCQIARARLESETPLLC